MNDQHKRRIEEANTFLSSVFQDAKFELVSEEKHTYQFRLIISGSEQNISVHKEEVGSPWWMENFFDWIRSCLIYNWKQKNMEWSDI